MFSKYVYVVGATQANVMEDLVAILTGTADKQLLSASCDKTNTSIDATTPAGWAMHDSVAGTNAKCLKAPLADNANAFKYVVVDTNTLVSGIVTVLTKVYETWNAGSHTGTNIAFNSDVTAYNQRVSNTATGAIYIIATPRFLLLASVYQGTWGSSTNAGPSGCFERTRLLGFDTVANGWPTFMFINFGEMATSANSAWSPKIMNRAQVVTTGTSASFSCIAGATGMTVATMMTTFAAIDQRVPDAVYASQVPVYPIYLMNNTTMPAPYGDLSLCNIFAFPSAAAANLDELQYNGETYIALQSGTTSKMILIRKT